MIRVAPVHAIVHRAGRSWHVQAGHAIRLLDGDVVEMDGRRVLVELADEPHHDRSRTSPRHAGHATALTLAAFLGLTAPVSAETPAASPAAQPSRPTDTGVKPAQAPQAVPTGKLRGKAFLAGGKPAANVRIIVIDPQREEQSTDTDDRGVFEVTGLKPGQYWVHALPTDQRRLASAQKPVLVKAGATSNVVLRVQRATVRTWRTAGKPMPESRDQP